MAIFNGKQILLAGLKGDDGKSAYEYARDGGYTGTEEEFAAKMAASVNENTDNTTNDTTSSSDNVIPSYWQTALKEGAETINTTLCEAGKNKSAFLFYSDAHWNYGSQVSPTLLKYLYEHTGMTKTFFGGDIVNDEASDYDTMEYLWKWRNMIKDLPNHHSVVGNHDDGNSPNNRFSEQYVYGYMFAAEETPDMVWGDGLYYYMDNNPEKTRYICLDTGYQTSSTAQTAMQTFLRETLISTPDNWHIVVISHIWYGPDYDQYSVRPIPIAGMSDEASAICTILDEYNSRATPFNNCNAKVEFCIGGHVHRDYVGSTDTGIPIVLVETDSQHIRSEFTYTAGTTTEASVNGVIADYDANTLHIVRIGRGNSFTVDLSTGAQSTYCSVTYNFTNVEASIMDSTYEKDMDSYFTTLTPTVGTIKSVTVTMGGTDITSEAYDAPSGEINISTVTGDIVITAVAGETSTGGSEETSYTNVLPLALAADGTSVYNGKGWKENTRWSSSGNSEGTASGIYLTGWIPVSYGDTIYLKNFTIPYENGNACMIHEFNNSFTKATQNSNYTYIENSLDGVWDSAGNLVQFTLNHSNTNITHIRIQCGGITSASVITINEPIE